MARAGTIVWRASPGTLTGADEFARRLIQALLCVSCLVIPLLFSTAQDDVFALPKVTAARAIVCFGVALGATALIRGIRLRLGAIDLAVAAFVALNLLAFAHSIDQEQSLNGERLQYQGLLTSLTYVGAFYLARIAIVDGRVLAWLLAAVIVGAAAVATYALVQKAGYDPIWSELADGRVFSSIGQPNALAAYLVMPAVLGAAMLGHAGRYRVGLGAVLTLVVLALFFAYSRAGLLALIIGISVAGAALPWQRLPNARRLIGGVVAFAAVGVIVLTATVPSARFWQAGRSAEAASESTQLHLDLWKIGIAIANDNPALGAGQETFPLLVPSYRDDVLSSERSAAVARYRPESPHNVFIATAAGAGYPALVAYLAVIALACAAMVRALLRAHVTSWCAAALAGILGAIVAHFVTDSFMTAEVTSSWLFWLLLGAGFAAAHEFPEESL